MHWSATLGGQAIRSRYETPFFKSHSRNRRAKMGGLGVEGSNLIRSRKRNGAPACSASARAYDRSPVRRPPPPKNFLSAYQQTLAVPQCHPFGVVPVGASTCRPATA